MNKAKRSADGCSRFDFGQLRIKDFEVDLADICYQLTMARLRHECDGDMAKFNKVLKRLGPNPVIKVTDLLSSAPLVEALMAKQ